MQFVAADDFGNIINPMIVEGQVHGGIAQGVGQALLESALYDEASGQLVTASYMDYTMPRADDLPSFKVSTSNTPCPGNPLGIKGCGEAGAIGSPPAVINAITDAIGKQDLTMPATPRRVWEAAADRGALKEERRCTLSTITAPNRVAEAAKLAGSGEAKYLSGGMTLIPAMKITAGIAFRPDRHRPHPGARRHQDRRNDRHHRRRHDPCRSRGRCADWRRSARRSAELAGHIGDPHVRHMGTIGGSIANNDPAADYPAAMLALDATILTDSAEIAAEDFFTGLFETALEEGEIVTAVTLRGAGQGRLREVPQPGLPLCYDRRLRRQGKDGVRAAVTGAGDSGRVPLGRGRGRLGRAASSRRRSTA